MIVSTNFPCWFGFAAVTIWPFIFIRHESANDAALIAHERAHLSDQRNWFLLPWWFMYLIAPRFRFTAEVIGFAAQIKAGGCSVQLAAAAITNRYWTFCTFAEAESAIKKELSK